MSDSRSITEYILAHPGETFDVTPFVDRRCKTPIEEIQAAVDGAVSPEQAIKLRQCLDHIDELEKHKAEMEREILRVSDPYLDALELIRTVPGFDKNPFTAIQILSEIGGDMSVFPTDKHLVSWAGCCPRNDQSNFKIKSTRISRAGSYLKPIAVCRMLLTAIWHILTDLKPYTAEGYLAPRPVKTEKILTTSQALNLLKLRGYVIKDDLPVTAS